jgi:hypothetical protein
MNTIIMRTDRTQLGITYAVLFNGRQMWHRFVPFGTRYNAATFKAAAREQEEYANRLRKGNE